MRNATICAVLSFALAACGGNPCEEYVEYLCDCACEDSCEDLKTTYENADSDLEDQCSAKLDEAEDASKTCETPECSTDTGGAG